MSKPTVDRKKRYGLLKPSAVVRTDPKRGNYWRCRCKCGKEVEVLANSLLQGNTTSCGCARAAFCRKTFRRHGKTKTRTYKSWCHMRARCYNSKHPKWARYGGRGIKVCERWTDLKTGFENFLADMGECPPNKTIDRIENDGDYCPDNCRWANSQTQGSNRNNVRRVEFSGRTMTLKEWALLLGLTSQCLYWRLFVAKWPVSRALTNDPR